MNLDTSKFEEISKFVYVAKSLRNRRNRKKNCSHGKKIVPIAIVLLDNEIPKNQKLLGYRNNRK